MKLLVKDVLKYKMTIATHSMIIRAPSRWKTRTETPLLAACAAVSALVVMALDFLSLRAQLHTQADVC